MVLKTSQNPSMQKKKKTYAVKDESQYSILLKTCSQVTDSETAVFSSVVGYFQAMTLNVKWHNDVQSHRVWKCVWPHRSVYTMWYFTNTPNEHKRCVTKMQHLLFVFVNRAVFTFSTFLTGQNYINSGRITSNKPVEVWGFTNIDALLGLIYWELFFFFFFRFNQIRI